MDAQHAVAEAKKHIKAMKRIAPYLFPQWSRLQEAKAAMNAAKSELKRAEAAWKALGK